ncbi:LuxR C-terminal-related transcriptional regulator, partial [Vibrio rumoiensis]
SRSFDVVNFVTNVSLQTSLLKDSLQLNCSVTIDKQCFNEFIDKIKQQNKKTHLTIIDLDYFTPDRFAKYLNLMEDMKVMNYEVLINADLDISAESIIHFPRVQGVFYRSDAIETINLGMRKMLEGEQWFSRNIAQSMIEYYRRQEMYVSKAVTDLTVREEQILKLLLMGASNGQIAEKLFVSENTVKTHLHNVFKKIKVKNRLQALMWAKGQNLARNSL